MCLRMMLVLDNSWVLRAIRDAWPPIYSVAAESEEQTLLANFMAPLFGLGLE